MRRSHQSSPGSNGADDSSGDGRGGDNWDITKGLQIAKRKILKVCNT